MVRRQQRPSLLYEKNLNKLFEPKTQTECLRFAVCVYVCICLCVLPVSVLIMCHFQLFDYDLDGYDWHPP